jgi:hypothetical protein
LTIGFGNEIAAPRFLFIKKMRAESREQDLARVTSAVDCKA